MKMWFLWIVLAVGDSDGKLQPATLESLDRAFLSQGSCELAADQHVTGITKKLYDEGMKNFAIIAQCVADAPPDRPIDSI